jgi:hypothetical protein
MKSTLWSPEDIEQYRKDCEQAHKEVSDRYPAWEPMRDSHSEYTEYTMSKYMRIDVQQGETPLRLWQFELATEHANFMSQPDYDEDEDDLIDMSRELMYY